MKRIDSFTHKKDIRTGLSIIKQSKSQFWIARIYVPDGYTYIKRSTKETNRIDAIEVAKEIQDKLNATHMVSVPKDLKFKTYANALMESQNRMSGKTKSKSYAKDDEKIIKRKKDGLIAYFGEKNIREINTLAMRTYLSVLDNNRQSGMSE